MCQINKFTYNLLDKFLSTQETHYNYEGTLIVNIGTGNHKENLIIAEPEGTCDQNCLDISLMKVIQPVLSSDYVYSLNVMFSTSSSIHSVHTTLHSSQQTSIVSLNRLSVGCVTMPRRQSGSFVGQNNAATSRILVNPAVIPVL